MHKLLWFLVFVVIYGLWGCEQDAKSEKNWRTSAPASPPAEEDENLGTELPCDTGYTNKNYVLGGEEVYVTYEIYFDCSFRMVVSDGFDYDHPYDDVVTSGVNIELDYDCGERLRSKEDKPHSIHILDYDFNGEVDYVATFGRYDSFENLYSCQDYSDDYERGDEADAATIAKAQELYYILQADLEQRAIENFSSRWGKIDPFRFL